MIIKKSRIRNVKKYLYYLKDSEEFYIGLTDINKYKDILQKVGFRKLQIGEKVLPSFTFGNIAKHNTLGKEVPQKDKTMETVYRQRDWTWTDWGGNEHWDIVDVPYKRYPREKFMPPGIEFKVVKGENKKTIIADEKLIYKMIS